MAGMLESRRIERRAALVGIELALDAIPEPRPSVAETHGTKPLLIIK